MNNSDVEQADEIKEAMVDAEMSSSFSDMLEAENKKENLLSIILSDFLDGMNDLREAIYISIPSIGKRHSSEIEKLEKEIAKYEDSSGKIIFPVSDPHGASKMLSAIENYSRIAKSNALEVLERSLFVGLFGQYDVFIGSLLRALYSIKPELYKSISREISLSDLLEFESLMAVKNDLLDKEIDSFKRESYIEQFGMLEKKFALPLRKFEEWSEFVELGQRRNLMTHTGGIVSEQYIILCEREGYQFKERPIIGSKLGLGQPYFERSINLLSKVAFMLVHTLWRKIAPKQSEIANRSMNANIYDLLKIKNWALAAEFGRFALSQIFIANCREMDVRIRVVNTSIALSNLKKEKETFSLLEKFDWSACIREFKLADAVLRNDSKKACEIMVSIGKKGELIEQLSYHQWPLFYNFCDSKEFQDAYFSIYSIPYIEKSTQATIVGPIATQKIPPLKKRHAKKVAAIENLGVTDVVQSIPKRRKKIVAAI
ncbi:hypothetical protein [Janthinobacterium sp. J1-1]|uniref:hypothetical protein n=1 Tax=Janthinobacterium sp. J1-1 TaxID=3065910 RepID=UPI00281107C2|nr:hypothetical protein [Janthinobacterium sp. J1-1]